ncbi:hypothetical protein [Phenylobacterium sp.]|uniref:hypothetical protein n=1 Tax=Phenylobacterium sp. TaxID=1871053 RepID=UPI00301C020F
MRIFTTPDAQGEPLSIAPGFPFRTYWKVVETPAEAAASGQPIGGLMASEIAHPWDALDRWDEAVLARFAITFEDVDDPPPPLPAEVPMYKVRKFLAVQGLTQAVQDALEALPEPGRTLALIDYEYAPNLVVQSSLALGVKAALDLTDTQYAEMVHAANAMP